MVFISILFGVRRIPCVEILLIFIFFFFSSPFPPSAVTPCTPFGFRSLAHRRCILVGCTLPFFSWINCGHRVLRIAWIAHLFSIVVQPFLLYRPNINGETICRIGAFSHWFHSLKFSQPSYSELSSSSGTLRPLSRLASETDSARGAARATIGDGEAMYQWPGQFPNIPVWRWGWGVPKGPKCETAHESGPKCESRELARRANEPQMWSGEKPGGNEKSAVPSNLMIGSNCENLIQY